jgi:hypothetical protein
VDWQQRAIRSVPFDGSFARVDSPMHRACRLSMPVALAGWALWLALAAAPVAAESPWRNLMPFKRVEADPEKDYAVSEEDGPWMILAVTFGSSESGNTEREARQLVYELRKRYKLPAYIWKMEVDLSERVLGRGLDEYGRPKAMRYVRNREFNEEASHQVAVLVGNYQAVDDPAAQATLEKLRYLTPECLAPAEGKETTRTLAQWRHTVDLTLHRKQTRGPMGRAFITANPLLPDEQLAPRGLDPFVVELNRRVEHSLLDCPGKYSVQVAMFTGKYLRTQSLRAFQSAAADDDRGELEEAAEKAHRLTLALREQGHEAYEFHDRSASLVCVGSFDELGTELRNGQTELAPGILHVMTMFGPTRGIGGSPQPKELDGIPFAVQPIPVEVPRRPLTGVFARGE